MGWFWNSGIVMVLGSLCLEDVREKKVSLWKILLLGGLEIGVVLTFTPKSSFMAAGILPGVFLLLVSFVTKGKIGAADGMILAALGLGLGLEKALFALILALLLTAVFSIIMLAWGRLRKKSEIAFLPFLMAGYIGAMLC